MEREGAAFEELAVAALCAWNGAPSGFSWPKDFPEGSRAAWRRVVTAILERNAAARTGAKPDDVPLSTDSLTVPSRGMALGISAGLGTGPQQLGTFSNPIDLPGDIPSEFPEEFRDRSHIYVRPHGGVTTKWYRSYSNYCDD